MPDLNHNNESNTNDEKHDRNDLENTALFDGILSFNTPAGRYKSPEATSRLTDHPLIIPLHSGEMKASMLGRSRSDKRNTIQGWSRACLAYVGLWQEVANDNPFADALLIHLENDLDTRKKETREIIANTRSSMGGTWESSQWVSREPLRLAIDTGNTHARRLAIFISETDDLIKLEKSLRDDGHLSPRASRANAADHQKRVRQSIYMPIRLHSLLESVTREEVAQKTPNAMKMVKQFGDVADSVMRKAWRPDFLPLDFNTRRSAE